MSKRNIIFIEIENNRRGYFDCMKFIERVLQNQIIDVEGLEINVSIYEYDGNKIVSDKLEEPLKNDDISSSIITVRDVTSEVLENIHFHIRVCIGDEVDISLMNGFHYLALTLEKFDNLIVEGRFSVFLLPNYKTYPFYNPATVNSEEVKNKFNKLSSYLRLLIKNGRNGIIYAVSHTKEYDEDRIVRALDFERNDIIEDGFPIMLFKKFNDSTIDEKNAIINKYVESGKIGKDKPEFFDDIEKLDNYMLMFNDSVVIDYFDKAKKLRTNYRFGFSNHSNAILALGDYIFEISYNTLKKKFINKNVSFNEYTDVLKNALRDTNIFCFALFSFLLLINMEKECEVRRTIENAAVCAREISSGVSQLIQNSLQHSTSRFCTVTFYRNENDELILLVSDISNEGMLDTFCKNISNEKQFIENSLLKSDNEKYKNFNLLNSYREMASVYGELLSCGLELTADVFYNKMNHCSDSVKKVWKKFRQIDSSAHVGLAIFSQVVSKYGGTIDVVTKSRYRNDNNYKDKNVKIHYDMSQNVIGTEYIINLNPYSVIKENEFTMTKISFNNYLTENYESYAKFIDFTLEDTLPGFDASYSKTILNKQNNLKLGSSFEKFINQFDWTRFWLKCFENFSVGKPEVYKIDLRLLFEDGSVFVSAVTIEMMLKGLINALDIFSKFYANSGNNGNAYFAFTNLSYTFFSILKNLTASLALKNFPKNLQLFFVYEEYDDNSENKVRSYVHLIGSSYGEAVCNSYNLSIENGFKSYENRIYSETVLLLQPFANDTSADNQKEIDIFPFTSFLKSDEKKHENMFFSDICYNAEKSITNIDNKGYKFFDTHTRLGNKVHINNFYEMSFLFYRTIIANRIAFEIISMMKNSNIDLVASDFLFFGYASYSEAILISLVDMIRKYRGAYNSDDNSDYVEYAVYQYNLRTESQSNEIKIYFSREPEEDHKNIQLIQIVPISSTLTTFEKIWKKFNSEHNKKEIFKLCKNYTVFWSKANEIYNSDDSVDISKYYQVLEDNNILVNKLLELNKCNINDVEYIITGLSDWKEPVKCDACYPENLINEIPLVETDPTSTVPSQQIYLYSSNAVDNTLEVDHKNNERISKLLGYSFYGHFIRGNNHFQNYIDTQRYFSFVSGDVIEWLKELRNSERENEGGTKNYLPCLNIIFSPEHNTNVGFSQYVNSYYFDGKAEIVSINEDKEFRSNFICEYAALGDMIKKLWDDFNNIYAVYSEKKEYMPVKFFFVDDSIISGDTFHKANSFLRSIIPAEYRSKYRTNVFEKCFILVDRLSADSKESYIFEECNFHAFCHIDISNMRKQGDSCICCKIMENSQKFFRKSATKTLANYWANKSVNLREISFDKIEQDFPKEKIKESYLMLAMSHIVKNCLKINASHSIDKYYEIIISLFEFFICDDIDEWCKKNDKYNNLVYYRKELNIDKNADGKTEIIRCLIKTVTRPFFVFDHTFKRAVLKFILTLSEYLINKDFEVTIACTSREIEIANCIKSLYQDNELLVFYTDVILDAIADLHSTYLIRKQTIKNLYSFVSGFKLSKNDEEKCKCFWIALSANIQRIVQGSSDETRALRLEHLLLTGNDNYNENDIGDNLDYSFEKIVISDETVNKHKTYLKKFYSELFLSNGHIYYDGIKKISKTGSPGNLDEYFIERWKKVRSFDYEWISGIKNSDLEKNEEESYQKEVDFYNYIIEQSGKEGNNNESGTTLKKYINLRYKSLLKKIKEMIFEKYSLLKDKDIQLAILTTPLGKENLKMTDLELIETLFINWVDSEDSLKYNIKEKVLQKLNDNNELSNIEYYVSNSGNYFIVCFENPEPKKCNADFHVGRKVRKISPVYLYIQFSSENNNDKYTKILWLTLRDILSYRDRILVYLEQDFTSDVMSRYAHSMVTDVILKSEKAVGHRLHINERREIIDVLNSGGEKFDAKEMNKIFQWLFIRNYTDNVIARLYNQVLRNIGKSVDEVICENNHSEEVSVLYVDMSRHNSVSNPVISINDIFSLAYSVEKKDMVLELFKELITFEEEGDSGVQNAEAFVYKKGGSTIAYNSDFIKGILYRIFLDALIYGINDSSLSFMEIISTSYSDKRKCEINETFMKYFKFPKVSLSIESSSSKNFDWLVIKNTIFNINYNPIKIEKIRKKLSDPLDHSDGHMSLLAIKEYTSKLHDEKDYPLIIGSMFSYVDDKNDNTKKYFVTRLPIIKKKRRKI